MGEELPRGWNYMSGAEYASAWNYINKAGQAVVTFTRPTESPPDWDDSLEQAAERGDVSETKSFLSSGGDPNAVKQPGGWPLISVVAKNGHTEALEALVEAGADLNARELGESPHVELSCPPSASLRFYQVVTRRWPFRPRRATWDRCAC